MGIKAGISEARNKLAALPHWVKVLMWAQVMLLCFSLACLATILAIQQEQIVTFWNACVTLMQQLPDPEIDRTQLRHAIKIGESGKYWVIGLSVTIMASAFIGSMLVWMTSWKTRK